MLILILLFVFSRFGQEFVSYSYCVKNFYVKNDLTFFKIGPEAYWLKGNLRLYLPYLVEAGSVVFLFLANKNWYCRFD